MIRTITDYLYRVHHEKVEMLTRAERRRLVLTCFITATITITIILWLIY